MKKKQVKKTSESTDKKKPQIAKATSKKTSESKKSSSFEPKKESKTLTSKTKLSEESKKQIEEVVRELVSDEALPIVFYLIGKTKVSEFTVAQDLDMEIHKARNLLYKLFENNILFFLRKKDKIKGWYICYWDFNEKAIPFLHQKIKLQKLEKLKERLEKESSSSFYMCKAACTRMDFERAMEFNFKCPECGQLMEEQNNLRTIEFLTEKIKELQKETKLKE